MTFLLCRYALADGAAALPGKPNFILILADDMGYGDCGCYGSTAIQTPNLDALARGGVLFTDFHSNGVVCSPTRAALLTGRYQQRGGVDGVLTAAKHRHTGLSLKETTFATLLGNAGYKTALFGKWHVGYEKQYNPAHRGFDEFHGFVSGNVDYKSHIDQTGTADWWVADGLSPEGGYTTDLVTEHGLRFITENRGRPFCLYLAHACPHYPYQGPADEAYRTPGHPEPVTGPREDKQAAYQEMMACLDTNVGRIVERVKSLGLEKQTLIFFSSDNGPAGPGSAGPLRGGKGTVWEGGHRVPAIACWPGKIPPGTVVTATCLSMDLLPTLMAVSGTEVPANLRLDGTNMMPLMSGANKECPRVLFWRFGKQKAVRSGKWKLVVDAKAKPGAVLYNLADDLAEQHDLAADYPDVVDDLKKKLGEWEKDVVSAALR